jgi:hypothetical protein
VDDVRERLSHVLWLGGAPRVGKSTLARLLAGKYDLRIYNLDWHHTREHLARGGPAMRWWQERTPDERWLAPSQAELLERSIAAWEEGFGLIVDDLLRTPTTRPVIADGPGAFPWLVAPLLADMRQALFLLPTPERWEVVLERRFRGAPEQAFGRETSDPVKARHALRTRDFDLAERLTESCLQLGLRCELFDGSLDLDDSLAILEDHFRPHLPASYNV